MPTMIMEVIVSCEIVIHFYQTARRHVSKRQHSSRLRLFGLLRPSSDAVLFVSPIGNASGTMFVQKKINPYAKDVVGTNCTGSKPSSVFR